MLHEKTKQELSRTIQKNKNNVRQFHATVERNREELEHAKRIEAARKKGFIADDEDYPNKPNVLATAFYGAIAVIIIAASIILLVT